MYSYIASKPASSLIDAADVYYHFLSCRIPGSLPVNCFATWSWNPPKDPSHIGGDHLGFCAKKQHQLDHGFKEKPDTRGAAPSLLRVCVSLLHTTCALEIFLTTASQSLSTAKIARPKYFKDFIIPRGASIRAEGPRGDRPLLLRFQAPSLLILPLLALPGAPMHPIYIPPWHHHVT